MKYWWVFFCAQTKLNLENVKYVTGNYCRKNNSITDLPFIQVRVNQGNSVTFHAEEQVLKLVQN